MDKTNTSTPPSTSKTTHTVRKIKRRLLARHLNLTRFFVLLFLVTLPLIALFTLFIVSNSQTKKYFHLTKIFLQAPTDKIESINERTNILILGKGGEGTTAPDLTDSIIFLSVNHKTNKATTFSLPRDIWLPQLRAKLNSVYYWGNQKNSQSGGLILAKSQAEEIVGVPIHYAIVIDFSGFSKIIDTLGGIEVEVENTFTDNWFPIPGKENDACGGDPEHKCRYETIHFEKGTQLMDGQTALKFARSRHSEDEIEGTDLARTKRQQKILQAIKNKALNSTSILLSPKKTFSLYSLVWEMIETDLSEDNLTILARLLYNSKDNINSLSLPEELLVNPTPSPKYDNLYVFIPSSQDQSYRDIHSFILSSLP